MIALSPRRLQLHFTMAAQEKSNYDIEQHPEICLSFNGSTAEAVKQEKALVWKQDLRIVPLCAAVYLLCYLDRSNIGE